jgi:UDP-MurNAc hydroxylase
MRLTVIGHACCFVETSGPRILVDPWLFGSAFWRSWWHYPPSPEPRREWLAPDVVYLTHHHFDHFHYPSMRRIDRSATVLVPEFGVDVMAGELRSLGFRNVRELPHGRVVELAPGVRVASYQYGADDTTFVVGDGDDVVVDINDCKIRGRALRQVRRTWGRPTFMLKSHSWAQAYPFNYTADDPADLEKIRRESYWFDFIEIARELRPRYAVPFGSMVAFLHPESRAVNDQLVTPAEVRRHFAQAPGVDGTEVVTMAPGDSWDSQRGFERSDRDWYDPAERAAQLARMAEEVAPKIDAQTALERELAEHLDFVTFARYFGGFLRSLPPAAWRRAIPRPVVFHVPSDGRPYWTLDFVAREVRTTTSLPDVYATVVTVGEGLLADAIEKRIVHLVHGAVRVRVHLAPGGFSEDTTFWLLLMMWELGYLPPRALAPVRVARVAWRRRREALGYVDALRRNRSGSFQERMVGAFASHGDE